VFPLKKKTFLNNSFNIKDRDKIGKKKQDALMLCLF
jgi:hypothetical protein